MRKFYLFALVAALFAACTNDTTEDVAVEVPQTLTVSFEEDTRIQLMNGKTVWNTGDLVSVFYKSDANDCYRFAGNTGERTSELVRTAKGEKSRSGDHVITVYPYSEDYIISLSAGTIEAHLPAEQTYVNESFGIGSSPMVSMSEYKQVVLKNVCGWLKVQFTGNGEVVDKITLRGNCGEQVAGDIMIVAEDASTILASAGMDIDDTEVGGTLVDEDSIITEVSLICPDGVTLGSEPTSFYIALPPQTFSKGLTVTLYSDKSGAMKQTTDKSITISRNIVQPLASVEANLQPNKIYYTSTDGKIVTPYRTTAFGEANIVSNTYEDNQGVIIFDAPVTEIGSSAFRNRNNLTSVTIPDSVTEIGGYAFRGCSSLTSVTIPDSVTTIGDSAFEDCSSLTSVTIPDSVTTLGGNPFRSCSKLTEFNGKFASADKRCLIVDGVLNSFAIGCGLTEYTIPDSVTEIGDYAFRYCSSLTSVTIPDSVTTIGDSAFEDCSSLTNVTIPDSVTKIGSSAFEYCSSLTSVTIPDSVTTIGTWAFNGCSNLTSVTIPDSVTKIRDYAFAFCSSLKSVYLASTTPPTLGVRVFQYNNNGEYKNLDCTIYVRSVALDKYKNAENWSGYNIAANSNELLYTSTDGNIVTPYKATAFGGANIVSNTYENGQGIITFDAPVTEIGSSAFRNRNNLTSVTIPDSVTTIGSYAFQNCSSLASVTIGNSVTTIGESAFSTCSNLKEVYYQGDLSGWCKISCTLYSANPLSNGAKLYIDNKEVTDITIPSDITSIGNRTFCGCSSLTSVIIPDSVTKIGESAFYGCSSLTSVTIPDSVTEIGRDAFEDCNSLTSVTIPDSVTSIGDWAFRGCSSLTSVTISDSITTLGYYNPFEGCSKLTEFNGKFASADKRCLIVDGVLNSFAPAGLTHYTIPDSVTEIGRDAFYGCSSLTSVIIPDSVTKIGESAFRGCSSLTSVTIPNSVTKIGSSAFYYCRSLTEVFCKSTIPPTLYGNVFESNTSHGLVIYVPKGYLETYKSAAGWCDYASLILEEGVEFPESSKIYYTSTDGNIVAPSNRALLGANILMNIYRNGQGIIIFDAPVTTIGSYAFEYRSRLTSVTIPNSVTEIGEFAFCDCSSLTSVTIPDSVTEIGSRAFAGCSSLTSVTIPDSVTEIGSRAFAGCSMTSVTIPDSVTKIGSGAFCLCDGLTEFNGKLASADKRCLIVDGVLNSFAPAGLTHYTIPDSVTEIGDSAFSGCSSLTSVTIPNSVTSIGNYAFSSCSSLTSVIIPYRVTMIGSYAFWRCSSLTSVTIPNSVTEIGSDAFGECSSLTSVTIPDSVTTIGGQAFYNCNSLTKFNGKFTSADKRCLIVDGVLNSFAIGCGLTEYTIPDSVTEIGKHAFGYCSSLTSVTIPDSVTKIADRAFYKCSSITNITIPNLVTSIGNYAFCYCSSLTSVTIPDSVTSIGLYAFRNCSSLKSVYCKPTTPPQGGSYMFSDNATGRKIYVPRASESAYEAAKYWRDYAADIEPYDF